MEISKRKVGRVTVLKVTGQATLNGHPERLSQQVEEHLAAGERLFVVNLAECPRMDSLGLGELAKSHLAVQRQEGVLKLADVPLQLRSLLGVSRLAEALEVYESEQGAINSFGA